MTTKNKLFSLDGKVVVITGAAGLLGKSYAEAIAAYGGTPVLLDLSLEAVNQVTNIINKKYSVNSSGYEVDITNELQIKKNLKVLLKKYKKIDGLINNAANNPKVEEGSNTNFSRLENFPLESWYQDIDVGLTGAFLCSKHYGNQISKNPNGGVIINISSDLGLIGPDQRLYKDIKLKDNEQLVKPVTYSIIKTGIIGLTRYLSTYWNGQNVRCNAMCPGGVENGQSESFINEISSRIPMNRMAQPDEYQGALIWMLSDASSYLNGAIIPIDGGRTAW